jgi:hypothetical protein
MIFFFRNPQTEFLDHQNINYLQGTACTLRLFISMESSLSALSSAKGVLKRGWCTAKWVDGLLSI